ncbi:spore cortex biosynthesis protein YabQ [Ruminococcus sp.]|uniref:spore cortex biosynthesis protein YabQ n=1 Tax=Ruminococcus sp. TaxID=41978 RepID=UPI0025FD2392|nr:spore cortex biosynthesis protein YabQ [uncultured Ruminococcus sp.]
MELETFFTVQEQGRLFWYSCLFGIPIGIGFDLFRILRAVLPHNKVLVALEDLIFCMLYALFVAAFSYGFARGHLRWYYPAGNLLGFAVYYLTAGKVVMGVIRRILGLLRRIFRILTWPLSRVYALIREKTIPFFVGTLQKSNFVKKMRKNT